MSPDISNEKYKINFDPLTKVISVRKQYDIKCRGLGYEYYRSMKKFANNVSQFNADTGTSETNDEILKQAIRVALHLKDKNIKKDDIVCLCSPNNSINVLPLLASLFLDVKFAPMDTSCKDEVAVYMLTQIKPKICFIAPESVELFKQSLKRAELESEIVVYDNIDTNGHNTEGCTPFSDFLKRHEQEDQFVPEITDPNDTCCIYFSSGSTGLPKGVCVTHKQIHFTAVMARENGLVENYSPVLLSYSTFYWISAMFNLARAIYTGGARVISKAFHPVKFWEMIDKYKITYVLITPFQISDLVSTKKPDNIDTKCLRTLLTGGGLLATELNEKLKKMLPHTFVSQVYGMTEAGVISLFSLKNNEDKLLSYNKPNSCGRPLPGIEYKIVDPHTDLPCGCNEKGELRLKSPFISNGYHGEDLELAFDNDGFLKTGDLGYFDEDFCFYVVDRLKELLKYRNYHISPGHLEQVLSTHPSVEQVAIVGVPHKIDGDHPVAVVILKENQELSEKSLEDYVNERVDNTHQLRGGVKFVKTFPLTASGKLNKAELRQMVLKGVV